MAAPTPQLGTGNVTTVTATASTYTVNKPANLADGDLLIAVPYGRNVGTWDTFPSGFVQQNIETVVGTFAVFSKSVRTASGEPATYSWHNSGGSSRGCIVMFRVTGANLGNPLDVAGAAVTSGTTTNIAAPSVTTGKAEDLLIGVYNSNGSGLTPNSLSVPTGMTSIAQLNFTDASNFSSVLVAYQQLSSAGPTGTRTSTASPAGTSGAGMLTAFAPIITAGAALSTSARSAQAGTARLSASMAGAVSARMTATASGAIVTAGADLSVSARISANTQGTGYWGMTAGGLWAPLTPKQMIGGSWS